MDKRIRDVEQGPDGNVRLLEDRSDGRLRSVFYDDASTRLLDPLFFQDVSEPLPETPAAELRPDDRLREAALSVLR